MVSQYMPRKLMKQHCGWKNEANSAEAFNSVACLYLTKKKKKSPPAAYKISTIITLSNQAGQGLIRFRSQLPSDTVTFSEKQNKRIGAAVVLPPDPSRSH